MSRAARSLSQACVQPCLQRLISWMLILKWIPARTPQGAKAECDTVPASVPTRILSAVDTPAANANNSWNSSAPVNLQVQNLPLGGLRFGRVRPSNPTDLQRRWFHARHRSLKCLTVFGVRCNNAITGHRRAPRE